MEFLFVVSCPEIEAELRGYIQGMPNRHRIVVANSRSSNYLRSQARLATTDFVFFHDCDDAADFAFIDSELRRLTSADTVHCYDVRRITLNDHGQELRTDSCYHYYKEGPITQIEYLPVCVYSKLIPTIAFKDVLFPNLPWSQDWAISYSLYRAVPHEFNPRMAYNYYDYPSSSSKGRRDTLYQVNKVNAFSRFFIPYIEKHGKPSDGEFLRIRYNDMLFFRYANLGIRVKPYFPNLRLLFQLTPRTTVSYVYQTIRKIATLIKLTVR
jgi:hypothetical protein